MISVQIPWHVFTSIAIVNVLLLLIIFYLLTELKDARLKHEDRTVKVIENHVKYTAVLDRVLLSITIIKDELKDELKETRRDLLNALREYSSKK